MSSSHLPKLLRSSSKIFLSIENQWNCTEFFFIKKYFTRGPTFIDNFLDIFGFQSTLFSETCAQFLSVLLIIFVGLMVTRYGEKIMHTWFHAQLEQKFMNGIYKTC